MKGVSLRASGMNRQRQTAAAVNRSWDKLIRRSLLMRVLYYVRGAREVEFAISSECLCEGVMVAMAAMSETIDLWDT